MYKLLFLAAIANFDASAVWEEVTNKPIDISLQKLEQESKLLKQAQMSVKTGEVRTPLLGSFHKGSIAHFIEQAKTRPTKEDTMNLARNLYVFLLTSREQVNKYEAVQRAIADLTSEKNQLERELSTIAQEQRKAKSDKIADLAKTITSYTEYFNSANEIIDEVRASCSQIQEAFEMLLLSSAKNSPERKALVEMMQTFLLAQPRSTLERNAYDNTTKSIITVVAREPVSYYPHSPQSEESTVFKEAA